MSEPLVYSAEEKVLCYHGPMMYEAKILKVAERSSSRATPTKEKGPKETQYYVHYAGWKRSWDEWVPITRLLKTNEANYGKQRTMLLAAKQQRIMERDAQEAAAQALATKKANQAAAAAGTSRPAENAKASGSGTNASAAAQPAAGPSRTKHRDDAVSGSANLPRKRPREAEQEVDYQKRAEVKIPIPEVLKVQLVDDWEAVTKNHQIVTLPRTPTVAELIEEYKTYAISRITQPNHITQSSSSRSTAKPISILIEVLSGLQLYFDRALGANLLYRFERTQYVEQRRKHQEAAGGSGSGEDFEASKIYGAEHLLRLFVNLPSFIAHTTMDAESVSLLREHIVDFMRYMVKEQSRIFQREYELASTTYINQSRA